MNHTLGLRGVCLLAVFLALVPAAMASTTWYVDGVNGKDGNDCKSPTTACKTIGHAISLAASDDSISVATATYTENLTINSSLRVIASNPRLTIVDGGAAGLVFSISSGTNVTLSGMTVRNGSSTFGGGIGNYGTLTLSNSIVTGNVGHEGGGLYNASLARMTVNTSTISSNAATSSCRNPPCFLDGGGVYNSPFGILTIKNSTISGNSADLGSAIYNIRGTVMCSNATVSGNSGNNGLATAAVDGDGGTLIMNNTTVAENVGGGVVITDSGTASLQNSIVANNHFATNCFGVTSNGYNLGSDDSCNFNNTGDLNNVDPILGPLQNNGGPTQTQALLPGSPAIDAGNPSGCTDSQGHLLKTDQRGKPPPDKEDSGGCDMGAYERQTD